jgi:hypothetical protein
MLTCVEKRGLIDELTQQTNLLKILNLQSDEATSLVNALSTNKKVANRKSIMDVALKNTNLLADEFNQGNYIYYLRDGEKKKTIPNINGKKSWKSTRAIATTQRSTKPQAIKKLTYTVDALFEAEVTLPLDLP